MPTRLRITVKDFLFLTAVLSSVAIESDEAGGLCGEGSKSCVAPVEIAGIPSGNAEAEPPAATDRGRWSGGRRKKRGRRVGFSHEDITGDDALRPFLQAFRDSLSGRAEDAGFATEQEQVPDPDPLSDTNSWTSAPEERNKVIYMDTCLTNLRDSWHLESPASFFELHSLFATVSL